MEEHDALGGGHGAAAPGDEGVIAEELLDAEHAQAVHEDGDVAAGDGEDSNGVEDLFELLAVAGDDGALEGAHLELVGFAEGGDALEVFLIDAADLLHREAELVGLEVGAGGHAGDGEGGVEGALEAEPVELLDLPELVLAGAVGAGEVLVGGEDLFAALVELEVDGLAAELAGEIFVLVFALLPAAGHQGDGPLTADRGDRVA